MLRIKVSNNFDYWPFIRQTPNSDGVWQNCKFYINQDIEECDFWVVTGGLEREEKTACPPKNTVFIGGEPPTMIKYNKNFLKQFNYVITCDKELPHPNKIYYQQAIPWFIGGHINRYDYQELKSLKRPKKKKIISAISTRKDWTEGHRKRIEFLFKLKEYFGDYLDIYGKGINDIKDKSYGILDYKYSIAIENSSFEDYWTEKLSDVFLGFAFPFYFGCPNIYDYFPKDSLKKIDINDIKGSIRTIEETIQNNCFEKHFNELVKSRSLVLDKYNFFPMMAEFCNKRYKNGEKNIITLKPGKEFEKYNFKKYFNCRKIYSHLKKRISNKPNDTDMFDHKNF